MRLRRGNLASESQRIHEECRRGSEAKQIRSAENPQRIWAYPPPVLRIEIPKPRIPQPRLGVLVLAEQPQWALDLAPAYHRRRVAPHLHDPPPRAVRCRPRHAPRGVDQLFGHPE